MNKQIGKSLPTSETLGQVAMSLKVHKVGVLFIFYLYLLTLFTHPPTPQPPPVYAYSLDSC